MTHVYRDSEGFGEALRQALLSLKDKPTQALGVFDEAYPASISTRAAVLYDKTPYGWRYRVVRMAADATSSGEYFEPENFEELYARVVRLFEQLDAAAMRRFDLLSRMKNVRVDPLRISRLGFEFKERLK